MYRLKLRYKFDRIYFENEFYTIPVTTPAGANDFLKQETTTLLTKIQGTRILSFVNTMSSNKYISRTTMCSYAIDPLVF